MRKGQIVKYNGNSVKVVSVNEDGTLTISHVGGSGRKGFAGKIVNPKAMPTPKPLQTITPEFGSEQAVITLDQYETHVEPINNSTINELGGLRFKYFKEAENADPNLGNTLVNLKAAAQTVGANFQDVIEGRCGIDECQYSTRSNSEPPHYPSASCKSGQNPHCTCNACF